MRLRAWELDWKWMMGMSDSSVTLRLWTQRLTLLSSEEQTRTLKILDQSFVMLLTVSRHLAVRYSSLVLGLQLEEFPGIELRVRYALEHRCGIVIHGSGLSDVISGTDPLKDGHPLCGLKASRCFTRGQFSP